MENLKDQLKELSDCLINYSKAIYDHLQAGLNTKEDLWRKDLFPILSNNGGDFLLVDTNNTSPTFEALLLYSPTLESGTPQTIYDNLSSFIETIIECFTKGIYRYDEEEGYLEVDYDAEAKVSQEKNPNSGWWQ